MVDEVDCHLIIYNIYIIVPYCSRKNCRIRGVPTSSSPPVLLIRALLLQNGLQGSVLGRLQQGLGCLLAQEVQVLARNFCSFPTVLYLGAYYTWNILKSWFLQRHLRGSCTSSLQSICSNNFGTWCPWTNGCPSFHPRADGQQPKRLSVVCFFFRTPFRCWSARWDWVLWPQLFTRNLGFCCHHLLFLYSVRMENVCHNPNSWSFNPVHWAIHSTLKFTTTFFPHFEADEGMGQNSLHMVPPNRCFVLPNHFICGPNSSWNFPYPVPLSTKICADFMTHSFCFNPQMFAA